MRPERRAAARLESIGFTRVYHDSAGKADWGAFGLQLEGRDDGGTRVGSIVRAAVPTCRLDERVADVPRARGRSGTSASS